MRARISVVIAAAVALVAVAALQFKKYRDRAEAERMMVWG
jgi:hypothetical protein